MADLRNTRLATAARDAANDAMVALAAGGKVRIYDGAQPAAGGAVTTQTLLWEKTPTPSPMFNPSSSGSCSLASALSATILADGTATWFRVLKSDNTILWDGNIGDDSDADTNNLELTNNVLGTGNTLTISTWTFGVQAQGV